MYTNTSVLCQSEWTYSIQQKSGTFHYIILKTQPKWDNCRKITFYCVTIVFVSQSSYTVHLLAKLKASIWFRYVVFLTIL